MLRSKMLQAFRLLSFAIAVSGLVAFSGGESLGEDVVRIVSKQSDKDQRGDYKVTLLNALLEHTTAEFGSYRIENVEPITRKRGFVEMLKGELVNIYFAPADQRTAPRAAEFAPLPGRYTNRAEHPYAPFRAMPV